MDHDSLFMGKAVSYSPIARGTVVLNRLSIYERDRLCRTKVFAYALQR